MNNPNNTIIKVGYHDDGKGKFQSHEVFLLEEFPVNYMIGYTFDTTAYGESFEEARNALVQLIKDQCTRLLKVAEELQNQQASDVIRCDCFGKPIR